MYATIPGHQVCTTKERIHRQLVDLFGASNECVDAWMPAAGDHHQPLAREVYRHALLKCIPRPEENNWHRTGGTHARCEHARTIDDRAFPTGDVKFDGRVHQLAGEWVVLGAQDRLLARRSVQVVRVWM